MWIAGWSFQVLSPIFAIHWGLQKRKTRPTWRERQNNRNRLRFKLFKQEVWARYGKNPPKQSILHDCGHKFFPRNFQFSPKIVNLPSIQMNILFNDQFLEFNDFSKSDGISAISVHFRTIRFCVLGFGGSHRSGGKRSQILTWLDNLEHVAHVQLTQVT